MRKGWAASTRSARWLAAGIVAVVLGLVVIWVLFVPAADWLAHHDVGSASGSLHETALDNARGRLLTLGAGLFAAGALVFTARNFTLSRSTVELTRRTFELTEQGQVTDRYTKAIGQLGSKKLDVRIGGIYALERIARDSARDHPTVMEVLTAFVREHSDEQWPLPDPGTDALPLRTTRPDVQAALTVVGRRDAKRDIRQIDLAGAYLGVAKLAGANLAGANLFFTDFDAADLTGANLTRASFVGANLANTNLIGADLADARLISANLGGANLTEANLAGANLTRASLTRARWPGDTAVPEGWKLDTGSGLLERVRTDSGPAEAERTLGDDAQKGGSSE